MPSGKCYCGAIRYETSERIASQSLCHCTMCRGTTGAPCVAWFTVPKAEFRYTAGSPVQYRSSPHGVRSFCGQCGTQLTFADDDYPDDIDVTTCSLDQPGLAPPRKQIFTDSEMPWMRHLHGLPRYRRSSSEGS